MGGALPWYLPSRAAVGDQTVGGESYRARRTVTLDFETTSLQHGDAREAGNSIVLAVVKRNSAASEVVSLEQLREHLAWAEVLVAHNAKFELGWLMREGLPWEHLLIWDTMIAEKVAHGNIKVTLSLDASCKRHGLEPKDRLVDALMKGGVCPSKMPSKLIAERCLRDVDTTYALYKRQFRKLSPKQRNVVFTRCIFTPVLATIERQGLYLDKARVYDEYTSTSRALAKVERDLSVLARGRNLNSPLQMAELLYDTLKFPQPKRFGKPLLTPSGNRPTSQDILKTLKPKTQKQKAFLALKKEHGKLSAKLSKGLNFFKAACDDMEGKFYGDFHQVRTATDRTSSTSRKIFFPSIKKKLGAQLQNIAREYKKLFWSPDPDWLNVEVDGAQLEFRVAGHLGDDEQVRADVRNGEDIHRFSASKLFGVPEDAVTDAQRTAAKAESFKPLYGGEYGTESQMDYYKAFRQKYNGVYRTQMGWLATALREKRLEMPWGVTFYFPKIHMKSDGYCPDKPNVFNYPVQNFATGEIIPISLTYLYWRSRLKGVRAQLYNAVHDSGVARVHREDIEEYRGCAIESFFDDTYHYLESVYGIELTIPLGVGFKAGRHWGEGTERKFTGVVVNE
jgi:DNA polymerase I-like protein with 3'-5' exonuclease and polymerase domains